MTPEQWEHIREIYKNWMPAIMEAGAQGRGIDPNFVDWGPLFSPIEREAWNSIRGLGVPLYPQLPVLNYFIDFGNPYLKIGLELDGRDYHDYERDLKRDESLLAIGWKIFRIPGSEAVKEVMRPERFEEMTPKTLRYMEETARWLQSKDGVIMAILQVYFKGNRDGFNGRYLTTLRMHQYADFEV